MFKAESYNYIKIKRCYKCLQLLDVVMEEEYVQAYVCPSGCCAIVNEQMTYKEYKERYK